ncbi:MAG: FtsW/RodA/SpoVE family cell cycle protein [Acidimicrobiales bacterium]|nr:FtsW/RodA/SpoVE family cell cycle protein [Acidimicrobiales bacterium]
MGRSRRTTELGLLVLVAIITVSAYTLASLGTDATIPANIGTFLGVVVAGLLLAHVVVRRLAPNADPTLLPLAGLLNGLGFVTIARVDEDLAWQQALWTGVGLTAFCGTLVLIRRVRVLEGYRWTFALLGVVLLLLPMVPGLGKEINGARIWVGLGPMSFQPGEAAKLCLAVFFASYLVEKRELLGMGTWKVGPLLLPDPKHLGPVLGAWGISLVVMIVEKDLGSSLLFFTFFLVMLWVATQRLFYVVLGFGLFAVGAYLAWTQFAHVQERVDIWLDPWSDPKGSGFQVVEAAFAMAFGGVTGTGLGLSGRIAIPAAENDFIFAVISQELGLLGGTAILVAYLLMVGAGLRIAIRTDVAFEKLLAAGLTTLLGVQAFIILAGVTRLLPLTGVALPFVSYGGTSLLANYVLVALLLRISDDEGSRAAPRPLANATAGSAPR